MTPTPPTKTCLWCGSSPLTVEDLVPKWLGKVLTKHFPAPDGYDFAFEATTATGPECRRAFGQIQPEVVVKAVCGACNSGWMSALETATIPLLTPLVTGDSATLSIENQLVVARWAAKVAVLLEAYMPGTIVLQPGDRQTIVEGNAPSDFHIRLAYRVEKDPMPTDFYTTSLFAAPVGTSAQAGPEGATPNAFSATLGLGRVAIAVVGGPGIANPGRWLTGGAFPLMIWPPTPQGIQWPPLHPKIGSRPELRDFHESFWERILNPEFPRPDPHRPPAGGVLKPSQPEDL